MPISDRCFTSAVRPKANDRLARWEKLSVASALTNGIKTGVKTIKEAELVVWVYDHHAIAPVAQRIERRFPNWSQGTWWPG